MNSKKNKVYQKHLTPLDREDIEKLLKLGFKFCDIADRLQKDSSTISKEIKKHRTEYTPPSFNNRVNFCKHKRNCKVTKLCNSICTKKCSNCFKCNDICQNFEKDVCEKLSKAPYVCNACDNYTQCRKIKYIYIATEAQKQYESTLISSRQGINLTAEELDKLDKLISPLIKQGQSIKLIYNNHKNEIPCSRSCLYNYIDQKLLSIANIDLHRRVRYKVRKKGKKKPQKDYSYKIGRTYEDFKKVLEASPDLVVVEMDTVEGTKGGKVLLTLLFRNCNFMIAKLLPNKTSESVKKEFDKIEKTIGSEIFKRLFKCILTDNGSEFQRPVELETSIANEEKRCSIYYCEANRSDQKGKIEKNHEYIRYIIPKGTSMNNYTQSIINLMMSHINSVARESLNFAIPYDMANIYLGMETINKLKISKIHPDDIILKPYLINK